MATVVHGCGSPQHHGSNISGVSGCLTGALHQHQHQQSATPMYPTMPKYSRSSSQPLSAPSHHHAYGGNAPTASGHQYNPPLPPVSYLPVGSTTSTAYWGHPHAATMMYRTGRHHSKRKSAVELLAETKPFYIKSDAVMERLHQSNYHANTITGKRGRNNMESRDEGRYNPSYGEIGHSASRDRRYAPPPVALAQESRVPHMHHHHHHGHHGAHLGRHHPPASGNTLMQGKLRMFYGAETYKERAASSTRTADRYRGDLVRKFDFGAKPTGGSSPYNSSKEAASVLSPQSYENAFPYAAENSSGDEPLVLTENYRPISPPAEYAADTNHTSNEQRSRYQRSYSHSHEVAVEDAQYAAGDYNINSHKSLPDLHSHISRHSPHSEILSCCSRGNRSSIKSTGESSLNRDSGGSSGHYTHRSEPCYRQRDAERTSDVYSNSKNCCGTAVAMDLRRDSGSSTQHSGCASPSYARTADCPECHCKNLERFETADYLLNYAAAELPVPVPEAFQDDYTAQQSKPHFSTTPNQHNLNNQLGAHQVYASSAKYMQNAMVQSPGSAPSIDDISPPPIQFKRQKCIRFKNRNRIALPNALALHIGAVSDGAGDTYHRPDPQQTFFFPKCVSADGYQTQGKLSTSSLGDGELDYGRGAEELSELEKFFDRLGLNDDKFHEIYSLPRRRRSGETDSDDSSTVFFSDVSTVDSMCLPDSTETQLQTTQSYRPSEPPSIVERNARIIKWLCNCRKLQQPQYS